MQQRLAALEKEKNEQHEVSPEAANTAAAAKGSAPAQPDPVATAANTSSSDQPKVNNPTSSGPFAFADFTWLHGNPRTREAAFDSPFFTPEIRADVSYIADFNHPAVDTIGGSTEAFRANEIQLTQLGVGGDFITTTFARA